VLRFLFSFVQCPFSWPPLQVGSRGQSNIYNKTHQTINCKVRIWDNFVYCDKKNCLFVCLFVCLLMRVHLPITLNPERCSAAFFASKISS
jgi:hypothetical protein